ncbi:MAG: Dak phosphatase [Actinobacteria bacterium 13_2_20CM_2_72_6]|nr:MAG: Dak phosphatase [Actinobacteria bacterium 13_2_20CM_2_72_6]
MLDRLDAAAVRRWCAACLDGLRRHQQEIDDLNVYPVPDGDTGTNLVLTLAAAHEALAEAGEFADTLGRLARGALLGARGNSGVIVAQLFKGLAQALPAAPVPDGKALATALAEAARMARDAVAAPVEGTVLSVADGAAEAAAGCGSTDLAEVARAAAKGAAEALARTPDQLPVLARAGVVDAGGRGLCVLLDALVEVVTGTAAPPAPAPRPAAAPRETGSSEYAYEVQYLLDGSAPAIGPLKAALAGLGDSLVVVGDGTTWNVHVHVNDIGAAIEAGIVAGRPHRIAVTRFADQVPSAPLARAAVVVLTGAGLIELFQREGAVVVPGPSPSTGELLAAIRRVGAGEVVVLPNAGPVQAVAAAAVEQARTEGVRAGVVPTRSPVQALAALAVRDDRRQFEDDLVAMAEAAGACRYAEVTEAAREAVTVAGVCRPGDILALIEGEVNLIGTELVATCRDLIDRMLAGGGELITLITGADAPADLGAALRGFVAERWPFVEVQVLAGGPPRYPLVVGVE